ncbi:DUF58 domain-containing protein [Chloroflexota bacterium]
MNSSETNVTQGEEKRFLLQPAGYLLSRVGLMAILTGLLLAAWFGQVVIVVLFGLVLSAAGLAKLWSRLCLTGVSCQCLLSERRIFPGEDIELRLRLINRKLLPLPWIQIDDEIPLNLSPDISLDSGNKPGFGLLSKSVALLWYTSVSWKHRLRCHRRGYYQLGPITVSSGDIFGFYPRSFTQSAIGHVIVYPRIFPIAQLGIPSLHPLGETTAERRIFEDPVRVIGIRDYSPHDSLRHVHWKASARHQNLQVKVFEPTTTLEVALFLAVDSFKSEQGEVYPEEDLEMGISTAASIANYLIERRNAVGLFANSRLADSGEPATILPGSSAGQLVETLEALAKITPLPSGPFEEFLQAERSRLPWGTTLVFILSRPSPSLAEQIVALKERGHKLMVLQVGDAEWSESDDGIECHRVRQAADLAMVSRRETK